MIYIEVWQRPTYARECPAPTVLIMNEEEGSGYRIAGGKLDQRSKLIMKHRLEEDDLENIIRVCKEGLA